MRSVWWSCMALMLSLNQSNLRAEEKLSICHAGLMTPPSFEKYMETLRSAKRFEDREIDEVVAKERRFGPSFLSSQVIVQEQQSGSGTYHMRMYHGLSDDETKYRNVTAWLCDSDDYPIVYFVGFRVMEFRDQTIYVTREPDIVNVISLKEIDPSLEKKTKVALETSNEVLCEDIAEGCKDEVFYGRH
jgi:hypothetical protein